MASDFRPEGKADELAALREERRARRSNWLGYGSLACPECDAPAPLLESPASLVTPLGCPYCGLAGSVRDFLSLSEPHRAPRVNVYVRLGA